MIKERILQFVDKKDSTNIIFLILFSLSFILSLLIFLTLTGNLSNLKEIDNVSNLISINFAIIVLLILISVGKIKRTLIKENLDLNLKYILHYYSFLLLLFLQH